MKARNLIFFLILIYLLGCTANIKTANIKTAENIPIKKIWHITYKTLSVKKKDVLTSLYKDLNPTDKYEKEKINELVNKYFSFDSSSNHIFGNPDCNWLKSTLFSFFRRNLQNSRLTLVTYTPYNTTACRWNDHASIMCRPSIYKTVRSEGNNIIFRYNLNVRWFYKGNYPSSSGYIDLYFNINNLSCENGTLSADIVFDKVVKKEPTIIFGQKMAEFNILWDNLSSFINNLGKNIMNNFENDYRILLDKVRYDYKAQLRVRYKILNEKRIKLKEKKYPFEPKVIISRIQRAFDVYKYDEKNNTFTLTTKVDNKKLPSTEVSLRAKIFPEINNTSVIVYEAIFSPILDNFSGKLVFTEKDVIDILKMQLSTFDNIIFK